MPPLQRLHGNSGKVARVPSFLWISPKGGNSGSLGAGILAESTPPVMRPLQRVGKGGGNPARGAGTCHSALGGERGSSLVAVASAGTTS